MTRLPMLALGCCTLLTACGDEPQQDDVAAYRVLATCSTNELAATLEQHADVALVLALDHNATGLIEHLGEHEPLVVGIGNPPTDPPTDGDASPKAIVLARNGADAAIELALLACNGIYVPKTPMRIGTRILTPAVPPANGGATEGELQTRPGDVVLELLRRQHAAVLTTTPSTDEIHRVGLIQVREHDAWQTAAAADAESAARRFPQVEFQAVTCRSPEALTKVAEQLVRDGCRAVLVTTDDPQAVATVLAAAAKAPAEPATVIVLDPLVSNHGTCSVGCSPTDLGRAAANLARQLLPSGGVILTVAQDPGSQLARQRHRGFVDAIGMQ